ncbi:hypothetical protein [Geomicrobium sp. JCM 19039]|nr:hypothetical protein [Geomicrobium sp. JCM 19039]GAK14254.1 putative decarboxylase [Geomicrobium sp. JCM 19039]
MIDSHTHFIPEQVQQWIEENKTLINAKWIKKNEQTTLLSINDKWAFPLNENFTRTQSFTAAYSSFRKALVSPVPQLFLYDQPVDVTSELVQVYNDALVHLKAKDATFEGLATLSLQSPEQAAKELEQAIQQG